MNDAMELACQECGRMVVLDAGRQELESPDVVSNPARLMQTSAEIDAAQDAVDKLYARWAELEAKKG